MAFAAAPAHADLGGNAASITTDRTAIGAVGASALAVARAATTSTSSSTYTVETITTTDGTTIHEYLSSSGAVFAIAWSGPFMPDLKQLLGTYFSSFQASAAEHTAAHPGRGPMALSNNDLVVFSGGIMRGYHGYAYLKNSLPAGLTAADIR